MALHGGGPGGKRIDVFSADEADPWGAIVTVEQHPARDCGGWIRQRLAQELAERPPVHDQTRGV
jgi:hypothetical protein